MSDKRINDHITKSYQRWLDYARYHTTLASISDQAEDVLGEVVLSLLQKDQAFLVEMLDRKKQGYTELDFYVLKMIQLNSHSKTSPYMQKMKDVLVDDNVDPDIVDDDHYIPRAGYYETEEEDPGLEKLSRYRKAREILDQLDITETEKKIFSWKFFEDNHLLHWPGPESYAFVRASFLKVKRMMINKIRNPHSARKSWTAAEINYLKNEYPNKETIRIAGYLERNYNSVHQMAKRLGLKKSK